MELEIGRKSQRQEEVLEERRMEQRVHLLLLVCQGSKEGTQSHGGRRERRDITADVLKPLGATEDESALRTAKLGSLFERSLKIRIRREKIVIEHLQCVLGIFPRGI